MTTTLQQSQLVEKDLSKAYGVALMQVVETSKVNILRGSDGIFYLRYKDGVRVEIQDFREYEAKLLEYVHPNGEKIRLLVDPTNLAYLSNEARKAIASADVSARCIGLAIVARNTFAQTLGSFFIYLENPPVPTKLFVSISEAREWLLSLS